MRLSVLLLLYFLTQQLWAQPGVSEGKVPSWVTPYEFSNISKTTETNNGYAYLLISRQSHLELKEDYYRYVMKVTSDKGLTTVASINEHFDPSPDDKARNTIVATEEYLLKDLWKADKENISATLYAGVLGTYLKRPDRRVRTMPLAVTHPRDVSQTIKIKLPKDWNIADEEPRLSRRRFRIVDQSSMLTRSLRCVIIIARRHLL